MGRRGLRELAGHNVALAHDALAALEGSGIRPRFSAAFFNEFVVSIDNPAASLAAAEKRGVLAGVALAPDYPELRDGLLISVTEMNNRTDFTRLAEALRGEG
jgi:glycine cleavage system pyridoxal-binding protein P